MQEANVLEKAQVISREWGQACACYFPLYFLCVRCTPFPWKKQTPL